MLVIPVNAMPRVVSASAPAIEATISACQRRGIAICTDERQNRVDLPQGSWDSRPMSEGNR